MFVAVLLKGETEELLFLFSLFFPFTLFAVSSIFINLLLLSNLILWTWGNLKLVPFCIVSFLEQQLNKDFYNYYQIKKI